MPELKIHPVAAQFPQYDQGALQELADDIKRNGQHQAIVLSGDGKTIIDGINRYEACKLAGKQPKFRRLPRGFSELATIRFIISANLRRRDLDPGQRAMLALNIAPALEAAAKERQQKGQSKGGKTGGRGRAIASRPRGRKAKSSGEVREQLAADAKVGHTTISKAKKVRDANPGLADAVAAGTTSLNDAYKQVRKAEEIAPVAKESEKPSATTTIVRTHDGKEHNYPLPKGRPKFNQTNDQVSWAAWTWNPVTGCLHNCAYCYAREGALMNNNLKPFYPFGFEPTFHEHRLDAPYHSPVPEAADEDPRQGRVFVSSMGDLFGKWVPTDWIDRVFAAARSNPQWEYLFLTKFPQRYVGLDLPATAWIGTTVDEQYRVKIAEEAFRKIEGVRVKWLSLEPLLAPLQFTDLSMFDFVVIGSQSATKQPSGPVKEVPPKIEWVMDLTAQAKKAGCKVYHKPNLIGVVDPQHAGMRLMQEVPNLPPLPGRNRQGALKLTAA